MSDGSTPVDTSGWVLPYHGRDEPPTGAGSSVCRKFRWAGGENSAAGAGGDGGPSGPSSSSVERALLDPPRTALSLPTQVDSVGAARGDAGDEDGRHPRATGTFLFVDPDKPLARGVTYGALAPNLDGDPYPDPRTLDADFARMAATGINAITTYATPLCWLLDLASAHGLFGTVGIACEHVVFLDRGVRRR